MTVFLQPKWLNLGCGEFKARPPWLNVDSNASKFPDIVASVLDLPFKDGTVDRIYAGHVIEHLELMLEVPQFLRECKRLLTPVSGRLVVVAPDIERARVMVAQGQQPESLLRDIEAGGKRWSGDDHMWTASASIIGEVLEKAGFEGAQLDITTDTMILDDWPVTSRIGWQCCFYVNVKP